jgi:cytosine deaminase
MLPNSDHYWLLNAHVPVCLLAGGRPEINAQQNADGLALVDLEIRAGLVQSIQLAQAARSRDTEQELTPSLDLRGGQVWPCFVDIHTHLDKGHIWERSPNPDGTFASALTTVEKDAAQHWNLEDVYRRMEFGLKCSYAYGTRAIRTHIDAIGEFAEQSFEAFRLLQQEWRDRLTLQAVCLAPLELFLTPQGEALADKMAKLGGVLGGFAPVHPELDAQLDRVFVLAQERGLNLDFHTDETDDPASKTLRQVAAAALRHEFTGQIVCGHCCSLAVQNPEDVAETLNLVQQARIGVVSLPLCNLYLQDRVPQRTPRWRGVTLLHELRQQGIPVAIANDNCRDPFHGFGDHDCLEVFTLSTKIAHLDRPYGDWPRAIATTPADLMQLPQVGRIGVGLPADLILFKGRTFSELLSRSQHDRVVLRSGQAIDTTLPDYAELDHLCGFTEIG